MVLPGNKKFIEGDMLPRSGAGRRKGRRRRGGRRRGCVPVRPQPRRVRRPVPRRSGIARSRQAQACRGGKRGHPPGRLRHLRLAGEYFGQPHRAAGRWRAGSRCGGRGRKTIAELEAETGGLQRRGAARRTAGRDRGLEGQDAPDPVHRSDRYPLPAFRDRAETGGAGRHVLPDGRVGLDDRAYEGSRQALLHAALRVPEAALSPCRDRLHPAYRPGRRGRRGYLLSRAGIGRHAGVERAAGDARYRQVAVSSGGLEHLRRAGLRRRQLLFGRRGRGPAADRDDPAGQPVFCLSGSRRGRRQTFDMPDSSLWTLYQRLRADGAPLSMRKVNDRSEIFPVFHDLFQRRGKQEKAAP